MSRIELSAGLKEILCFAAEQLKGSARRLFMAKTVKELGRGGQRLAEHELGWNRGTTRSGFPKRRRSLQVRHAHAHRVVKEQAGVLRVSWDAKAPVKIGLFSRGGRSRVETTAWNHDLAPQTILTPFNLFLPEIDLDPKNANAYWGRGITYQRASRNAQAVSDFQMYLKLAPNAPDRNQVQQLINQLK